MRSYDHLIGHFEMMLELAHYLPDFPIELLAHAYHYESFGSWWFTFMHRGERYRVVYDGKDSFLRFETSVGLGFKEDWHVISEDPVPDRANKAIIDKVLLLIRSL